MTKLISNKLFLFGALSLECIYIYHIHIFYYYFEIHLEVQVDVTDVKEYFEVWFLWAF